MLKELSRCWRLGIRIVFVTITDNFIIIAAIVITRVFVIWFWILRVPFTSITITIEYFSSARLSNSDSFCNQHPCSRFFFLPAQSEKIPPLIWTEFALSATWNEVIMLSGWASIRSIYGGTPSLLMGCTWFQQQKMRCNVHSRDLLYNWLSNSFWFLLLFIHFLKEFSVFFGELTVSLFLHFRSSRHRPWARGLHFLLVDSWVRVSSSFSSKYKFTR